MKNLMSPLEWFGILIAALSPAVGVVVFAYEKFETKDIAMSREERLEKRLDRIESKIDVILEKR